MKTTKQDLEAERFLHRAMKYLTASFPERSAAMDAETLKNKVIDDCEYALSYGYETERDVMGLVDFLWRLPSDFRKDPQYGWVEEILSDKDSDAELKTESLQNAYALFTAAAEQGEADHVGT